jgi:outer membrane protein assembly factor BamB
MKAFSGLLRGGLSACAVLSMVSGCGGSQTQTNALVPGQSNAATAELGRLGVGSSMAADAQSSDLLYVADAKDGSVQVYSYPTGKPQGRLLDVRANALCAGKDGDVFAPAGNEVLRYAHGGTRPIAVLHDPLGTAPQSCAVDSATGNLAVSGGSATQSGIAIYVAAKGSPTIYAGRNDARYGSVAYDSDGNLFALTSAGKVVELANAGKRFRELGWSGAPPTQAGSIQWDGKYLAVASDATISRYAVADYRATPAGEIAIKGAANVAQFWIHKGKVVIPDSRGVALYGYPAGGSPLVVIKDARAAQAVTVSRGTPSAFAITTYHYDNFRTGWNNDETTLTYGNVNAGSFGLLHSLSLDDQVDTQPLLVPNVTTTRGKSPGAHDVVYVATENNTVYAIDASSGTILFQTNLGAPVPAPLGCNNNGPNVGIDGTPVIDRAAGVMYVIAYTLESSVPTYRIHELSLSDLSEVAPSVVVSASHTLTDGTTFNFDATYQRQRPGLLEANGNIYAGFGSFCDFSASQSRGWLLGWQAGSLIPLAANRLNDSLSQSPHSFFLTAIWMSGYGVAADPSGNIYFVTGNSDYSGNTYNGVTNVPESVVKVSADLTQLLSIFTPFNVGQMDQSDADLGSGGVMLLPVGSTPLAAAAGKTGTMYVLDQNNLGGYVKNGPNNDVAEVNVGGCWCGPSYYAVKKKHQRIVASGGSSVTVWNVKDKHKVRVKFAGSAGLPNGQDPGFFTTVSSAKNGRNAIIWALARPQSVPGPMTLVALAAERGSGSQLPTLYQASAGYWAAPNGNANTVPVVANGKVYIASYQQLQIFGLGGSAATASTGRAIPAGAYRGPVKTPNEVTGTLVNVNGSQLTLRTRDGRLVRVDGSAAVKNERSEDLIVGRPFDVRGTYDAAGIMRAAIIIRAKPSPSTWPPDR